tara:strand:+ start:408 stop:926 length:519 start_codon:yes stop_codon:yes gene_type:complete
MSVAKYVKPTNKLQLLPLEIEDEIWNLYYYEHFKSNVLKEMKDFVCEIALFNDFHYQEMKKIVRSIRFKTAPIPLYYIDYLREHKDYLSELLVKMLSNNGSIILYNSYVEIEDEYGVMYPQVSCVDTLNRMKREDSENKDTKNILLRFMLKLCNSPTLKNELTNWWFIININ